MTTVKTPTRAELEARKADILRGLELTADELATKVAASSLAGDEWAASAEIDEIDYLLEG